VKVLQHQYIHQLEPIVSNQRLFVCLGGRDLADTINEERKKEQVGGVQREELVTDEGRLKVTVKKERELQGE
jgi:hypothetical protein